jgi:hypothetical protein
LTTAFGDLPYWLPEFFIELKLWKRKTKPAIREIEPNLQEVAPAKPE